LFESVGYPMFQIKERAQHCNADEYGSAAEPPPQARDGDGH